MSDQQFTNQHIVVVGGSSGMGLAVAQGAHRAGARVTVTSRSADRARAAALAIGPEVQSAALDVNDGAQVEAFFAGIAAPDHVYVAAGSTKLLNLLEGDLEAQFQPLNERILGSVRVARAAALRLRAGGSVTFTGGISTDRPVRSAWVSGVGTAAAEQLARVLALELAPLRFNAVSPGYTDTPMWDVVLGDNKTAVLDGVAATLPVRRIATADEVADAVLFLMRNGSITGEVLHIDGGGRLI